ncbi:MAG: SelB C-terminal domain-containing protein, partial [Candidatus Aminicenantales bacterium]
AAGKRSPAAARPRRTAPPRSAKTRLPAAAALPPMPLAPGAYPGDLEKLDALARAQGVHGLTEETATIHLPLDASVLTVLAQQLEEIGRIRILSFRPLHLVAQEAVDFLGGKVTAYIAAFHRTHLKEPGVDFRRLADHFDVPRTVLKLALKSLVHGEALKEHEEAFALPGFKRELPVREEKALEKLEEMCFGGDFRALTLRDIHQQYDIALPKLEAMLNELIERQRIISGQDGFYVHARWLDELTAKLRALGRKELTIAEFKSLTGLSRKFAIPLLELLDERGVTRRHGSVREIL